MQYALKLQRTQVSHGLPFVKKEAEALSPPSVKTVSQWADKKRVMQPGTSRVPGKWSTETTPYLKEVMNTFNDPYVRHIVLCFGTQLGKTESIYNMLGYIIDMEPHSTMLLYPTREDARSISRTRLQPMIEANPDLRSKKPLNLDLYTLNEMHFSGMVLYVPGANSASALAQKPVKNLLRDEIDIYPPHLKNMADPLSLSEERTKSYWDIRKIVDVSSPTEESKGIWHMLNRCQLVHNFFVPCPHCKEKQKLVFDSIKFEAEGEDLNERLEAIQATAMLHCVECKKPIPDYYKPFLLQNGKWISSKKGTGKEEMVGFHLSSLYSPWITWADVAKKFYESNWEYKETGNAEPLKKVVNTWLAKPFGIKVKELEEDELETLKTDIPEGTVPAEAICLTCGVDVHQTQGFFFAVWAWMRKMGSHLVRYGWLPEWQDVFDLIFSSTYPIQGQEEDTMGIWRAGLDTGGSKQSRSEDVSVAEECYTRLREWPRGTAWGVKGVGSGQQAQRVRQYVIDKMPGKRGLARPIPGGLVIWRINVDLVKDLFFWRLKEKEEKTQPARFHQQTGLDFFKHLLAEEKRRDKYGRWTWHQLSKNNHWLDASIYAHACADPQFMGGISVLPEAQVIKGPSEAERQGQKRKLPDTNPGGWLERKEGSSWIRGE